MVHSNNKQPKNLLVAESDLIAGHKWIDLSTFNKQQNVLLYFVCSFTCSRCWRGIISLGRLHDRLQNHHTTVLVVGDDRYLQPAARLANDFELPFSITADKDGALHREYDVHRPHLNHHSSSLVLIDKHGTVYHHQRSQEIFDPRSLITAVIRLGSDWRKAFIDDTKADVENNTAAHNVPRACCLNKAPSFCHC